MHKRIFLIAAACCVGLSTGSQGEDLIQIYDIAVTSDPTLREAEQNMFATREVKPQAKALLLPDFGVVADYDYVNNRLKDVSSTVGDVTTRRDITDRYNQGELTAVLNQPIWDRGLWISLDQTDDIIAQSEAEFRNSQIDLMVRTTEAYFGVLRAADAVRVQESLQRANERQLEQSRQRFEVGLVAITDVNESQAAYDRSRADVISAKNELNNQWEALRNITGPIDVPLARLGDKLPLAPPEPNDINQWAETALKNNYGVVAAKEAAEAAKKEIEIQRSGHYPSFDLQAGYDILQTQSDFSNDRNTGSINLQMTLPLYQGGAVTSRTRQAGYDFRAAQDRLDQQRRAVIQQVKDAFRGILSSISDVKARQAAVVSARSALESTQAGLEVGTRTQVDVLNAQRSLFQAEFDYLSSRYNYIINGVLLHQATSTLTRDVLVKGNSWLSTKDPVPPPSY